ncbi:MAG: YrhK family protein [Actinomycetota bacterium]
MAGLRSPITTILDALDRHGWVLPALNLAAAITFAAGSMAFYWESLFRAGITLFVIGSTILIVAATAELLRRLRPDR